MRHHNDLDRKGYSEVLLRVAVALVKADVKRHRAAYVDNRALALTALAARLRESGMMGLAAQMSFIGHLANQGVRLDSMVAAVFHEPAFPPYSKYGGRAGSLRRRSGAPEVNPSPGQLGLFDKEL